MAVGTRVTPECLLEMMLMITAEAQILLAGEEPVELQKQERSSEVGAMFGCVQHQDRMARAVRWIRRSGKCVSHGDEQR